MTMRIYTSSDASAPVLEGVVGGAFGSTFATGSFVELLRQVLVAGYGSTTAAGWTMPYTATSRAAFKQGAGCGFYLDVLDDGSLTAGAREAQLFGYEIMTASGTGTGQFPTAAQQATGIKVRKSDTADATQRPWVMYADASTWYFFSVPQYGSGTAYFAGTAFGNFHSIVSSPADAYNCMICGRITTAIADTLTNEKLDTLNYVTNAQSALAGFYVARGYNQAGTAVNASRVNAWGPTSGGAASVNGSVAMQPIYPNPPDSSLILTRQLVWDTTSPSGIRGWMRGFYGMAQISTNMPPGLQFAGTGATLSGKTIRILGLRTGGDPAGRYVVESSDTWDSA